MKKIEIKGSEEELNRISIFLKNNNINHIIRDLDNDNHSNQLNPNNKDSSSDMQNNIQEMLDEDPECHWGDWRY